MVNKGNPGVAGYCLSCNSNVGIPGARFCPTCGAELQSQIKNAGKIMTQPREAQAGEKVRRVEKANSCMICQEPLGKNDYVRWCPFCGKGAHKTELENWLRSKRSCPSCNKMLTEKQLQDASVVQLEPAEVPGSETKTIVHRGHSIRLEATYSWYNGHPTVVAFHDEEKVSAYEGPAGTVMVRQTFHTSENGRPVQYDVRWDLQGSRSKVEWKFAVLRNGRFIYNEGIPIMPGSQTMREIRADLKSHGIDEDQEIQYCPRCGVENLMLDPLFCACCGSILTSASEIAASGAGVTDGRSQKCIVCHNDLVKNLKKGETLAWCPFCGGAAHTHCLLDSLKKANMCPSCSNTLPEKDFVSQLKKRGKNWVMKPLEIGRTPAVGTPVLTNTPAPPRIIGSCIVCKDALHDSDKIVRCPHCGGVAHRGDFLEWIHVKGRCPSCQGRIDEKELEVLSEP